MAAVVQQPAVASALEHRPGSQGGEPGAKRRGSAKRVHDQLAADLPAVGGPDTADTNRAAGPVAVCKQRDDTSGGREHDVVISFHRPPKRVLQQRPPRADRDQPLIALLRFRGQELVLPVLPRAQREDVAKDVRSPVKQNLAAEREKVVRLAEVRDPRPVPALEQPVRVTGDPRPVALYQEHTTTTAREGERRGKTSQPSPEHNNIAPAPGHVSNHLRLPRKTQTSRLSIPAVTRSSLT
jgi:hypothetical protein